VVKGKNTRGIPILLLCNLDPSWSSQEQKGVVDLTAQLSTNIKNTLGDYPEPIFITTKDINAFLAPYNPEEYIVFNWCEELPGIKHSEWMVADYLEKNGFAFTGAGANALALAQDKSRVKHILEEAGIATPQWQVFRNTQNTKKWSSYPAIVKAAHEHCSQGIDHNAIVTDEIELKNRISYVLEKYHQPALVEEFIDGRELHVSLLGNDNPIVLPPAEMYFPSSLNQKERICSYEAKFTPESDAYRKIETVLPAPLSNEEIADLEEICKKIYFATGCRYYDRIDIRMKDGIFYTLDVNPNADISPDTSTVAAAENIGYSYGQLLCSLVNQAVRRHSVLNSRFSDEFDNPVYSLTTAAK